MKKKRKKKNKKREISDFAIAWSRLTFGKVTVTIAVVVVVIKSTGKSVFLTHYTANYNCSMRFI